MTDTRYQIDADMLGPEFSGTLADLHRFVELLAEHCEVDPDTFELAQHVGQRPGAPEPTEWQWNDALDAFAAERPDLFGAAAETLTDAMISSPARETAAGLRQ